MPVPWTGRDVALALGMVALLSLFLAGLMGVAVLFLAPEDPYSYLALMAVLGTMGIDVGMLATALWFSVGKYRCSWQALGFRRFAPGPHLAMVGLVLLMAFSLNLAYGLATSWAGIDQLKPPPLPPIFGEGGIRFVLGAVLAVALAPLTEETFFRGFVFSGLRRRYGFWWGAIASSGLFALGHLALGVLIPIFILGLLLAGLYARTGSIWPPIIAHLTYNGLALLLAR